jgi:hypothetical protein
MRAVTLAALGLIAFTGIAASEAISPLDVSLDYRSCEEQVKSLLRLDLDCTVAVRFGETEPEFVPAALRPIFRRLGCSIPLRVAKRDLYGHWIQAGLVDVPPVTVACKLSVAGMSASEFRTTVALRCQKTGNAWNCVPNMRGTSGLGVIGTQLERYVNDSSDFHKRIGRAMDELKQ